MNPTRHYLASLFLALGVAALGAAGMAADARYAKQATIAQETRLGPSYRTAGVAP